MASWLTKLFRSLFGSTQTQGSEPPYVWKKKGVVRAARGNVEGRGHFGVDQAIFRMDDISGSAKKVYMYLCRVADAPGYTFPFLRTIAARTGLSESTVGKALKELERASLVEIQHRYSRRGGSSNIYHLRKVTEIYPEIGKNLAAGSQDSRSDRSTSSIDSKDGHK